MRPKPENPNGTAGRPNQVARGSEALVLGIMSGTSLDAVDFVLARLGRKKAPGFVRMWKRAFPAGLRRRLLDCAEGKLGSWPCGELNHDLGRFYAAAALSGLGMERIAAVGLHGQTVYHRGSGRGRATWQLGEPAYLVEALRVPVVSNFRAADMASGGQGAPLATAFHFAAFARKGRHVCVQNLGGIGNVTSMDWRQGVEPAVLAFDTGPGNMLMDGAMVRLTEGRRRMDRGGRWAAEGRVERGLLTEWLRHAYFRKRPPKSTGRELFGRVFLDRHWDRMLAQGLGPKDCLATLSELTACSVALNYDRHLNSAPDQVVVCGGGAKNPDLVRRLRAALPCEVSSSEELGWPVDAVEGGAFAFLAWERLNGRPGNVPSTTGAARKLLCGQVSEP